VTVLGVAFAAVALLALPVLAAEVSLTDDGFDPETVEVTTGEDIVWVNMTDEEQTIVGDGALAWDSGPIPPGGSFSVALREAGTFSYSTADGEHEGTIEVSAEDEADDADADEGEESEEAAADVAQLPTTGEHTEILLGMTLLLLGAGALLIQRSSRLVVAHQDRRRW
jgi:LPXTG-motif cell wall-anchored protein